MDMSMILFFIFMGVIGALAVVIVIIILVYILPMKNSPAKFFLKAKKEKKPVIFLDNGSHFVVTTAKLVDENAAIDEQGNAIIVSPDSLKYCLGVLMGVGENYRSILTNAVTADFVGYAVKNKFDSKKLSEYIKNIEKVIEEKAKEIKEEVKDVQQTEEE